MRTLLATIALAIGISASAQDSPAQDTPQQRATQLTEKVSEKLGLNAEQKEKVASINIAYETQMANVLTMKVEADRAGRMQSLESTRDRAYGSVLTPEQYAQWKELHKANQAK